MVVRIVGTPNAFAVLAERGNVVDYQRGIVAVDVGQLRWLVIDQENRAVLRGQEERRDRLSGNVCMI